MATHPLQRHILEGGIGLLIAYLHKGGLEVYKVTIIKGSNRLRVERFASGPVSELKPIRAIGKRVLIVARGLCFHLRKRYPPASIDDLKKAVQMDIEEITPVRAPMHYFRVFERSSAYALLDIWAWERAEADRVRAVFAFTHVVPEDAAFVSMRPEISIFIEKDIASLVAYGGDGFIGSASIRDLNRHRLEVIPKEQSSRAVEQQSSRAAEQQYRLNRQRLEIFLKGLGRHGEAIEAINIYGTHETRLAEELRGIAPEVALREPPDYPVCIDYLPLGKLEQYKIQADYSVFYKKAVMGLRFALYGTVAIALSTFITLRNYEHSIKEIDSKIAQISKEVSSLLSGPTPEDYSDILKELDVRLRDDVHPMKIMDLLAQHLPQKSHVTRLMLNERNMEVTIISPDPLGVVKTLGQSELFKSVKLRGAPLKGQKGEYTFTVVGEGR